jgi:hypothetical protein
MQHSQHTCWARGLLALVGDARQAMPGTRNCSSANKAWQPNVFQRHQYVILLSKTRLKQACSTMYTTVHVETAHTIGWVCQSVAAKELVHSRHSHVLKATPCTSCSAALAVVVKASYCSPVVASNSTHQQGGTLLSWQQ